MQTRKKIHGLTIETFLLLIFVIQVLLIAVSNLTLIDKNLDCDTGKMFRHIIAMWDHKSLTIPGWEYVSTMELDCTALFAIFFYGLTKNIYLACGISNIILFGLFSAAVFYLMEKKGRVYQLLAMNLIAVPYAVGMLDYYNMLFFGGGQYVLKVMVPLLLIGIFLHLEQFEKQGRERKIQLFVTGVYFLLVLLVSVSSGIYVTVCGLFPVLALYILRKFFSWEKLTLPEGGLIAGTLLCSLGGTFVNVRVTGGVKSQGMVFNSVYHALGNFSSCFIGIFELMGGATKEMDIALFSIEGIGILLKIFLVMGMLICLIYQCGECLKRRGELQILLLMAIPIWNYFILNVANARAGSDTYEYRYHLIGMIPLMLLTVITLLDGLQRLNETQRRCLYIGGLLVVVCLNVLSFQALFNRGEQNADLKELCAYCKNTDVDIVYMYEASNDSDICRAIDQSVPYICLRSNGTTWTYDYYACYIEAPMQAENAIVVVDNGLEDWGERYELFGHIVNRFDIVAGRSLYCFE